MLEITTVTTVNKYEAIIIMHPDASEEQQKELFRKNADILKSNKGSYNHVDTWGKRRLANPIDKMSRGTYFHTTFETEAVAIKELERTMNINDQVLRFSHFRLDDRVVLTKFVEDFYGQVKETKEREKELKAKQKIRKK